MKRIIILMSFLIPFCSLFLDPSKTIIGGSLYEYAWGFPVKFITHRTYEETLTSHFFLFYPPMLYPPKLKTLNIQVLNYFISAGVVYICLRFIMWILNALGVKKKIDSSSLKNS